MEILTILKIINILATLALLVFANFKIKDKKSRVLFILMYVLVVLSTVLFGDEEHLSTWLKHLPFYTGQFFMFLFLRRIIFLHLSGSENVLTKTNLNGGTPSNPEQANQNALLDKSPHVENIPHVEVAAKSKDVTLSIHISLLAWLLFVTEQGLQHVLVLPFHFLIASYVRVHFSFIKDNYFKKTLNILNFGSFILVCVHFGEFIVESQKLIPIIEGDIYEYIEVGWFYFAALIFYIGLRRVRQ